MYNNRLTQSAVAALFLIGSLALPARSSRSSNSSAAPASQHVTLTGYISCTTCFLPNTCKAQTRLSCTESWVNRGASYVLVVDGAHYRLSGFERELAKAAAENSVTVSGDLSGTDIVVTSVEVNGNQKL